MEIGIEGWSRGGIEVVEVRIEEWSGDYRGWRLE